MQGDPGMEPMRQREATGTSPEGRNSGEDARWPVMDMGKVKGLREQVPSSAGVQEFPWSPPPCLTNISWAGSSMAFTSPSLTLAPSLSEAVLPHI